MSEYLHKIKFHDRFLKWQYLFTPEMIRNQAQKRIPYFKCIYLGRDLGGSIYPPVIWCARELAMSAAAKRRMIFFKLMIFFPFFLFLKITPKYLFLQPLFKIRKIYFNKIFHPIIWTCSSIEWAKSPIRWQTFFDSSNASFIFSNI